MTNKENLQSMPLDMLAEWLNENGQFDGSPWMEWFNENYCNSEKCPAETCKIKYSENEKERDIEVSYCELEKKCKFFPELPEPPSNLQIIKMWLDENLEK